MELGARSLELRHKSMEKESMEHGAKTEKSMERGAWSMEKESTEHGAWSASKKAWSFPAQVFSPLF
jgi:hypothetical protein